MDWVFNNEEPIYLQIVEKFKLGIISGYYQANSQIPSVRQLADIISVNPNTIQKAMSQLEEEGIVYTQGTTGRFIVNDKSLPSKLKNDMAKKYIENFIKTMQNLGFNNKQIIELMKKSEKNNEI